MDPYINQVGELEVPSAKGKKKHLVFILMTLH